MRAGALLLAGLLTVLTLPAQAAQKLSWGELVPPDARAMMEMPQPTHNLADLANALEDEYGDPAVQMQPNAPVVQELQGREVMLPGYIVPLGISERGEVNEFLLVPYFGACIHVPPPPSNQIVYVTSEKGIKLDALWQPFWVTGPMQVEQTESDLANAGYRIVASAIEPYVY
jgi:uncharacterized protein